MMAASSGREREDMPPGMLSLSKGNVSGYGLLMASNTHRQSLQERDKELAAYRIQETTADNRDYQQRLAALRQRCVG